MSITEPSADEPWIHHTGIMNVGFIKPYLDDSVRAIFYLAGPAGFVNAMRGALDEVGIDPDNLRTEEFPGY